MKVIKDGRWLLALVLPLAGGVVHAAGATFTVFPYQAAGIGAPSLPAFLDTAETVNLTQTGTGTNAYWTLSGTGSAASLFGGNLLNVVGLGSASVNYQANFDATGNLIPSIGGTQLTNSLTISGSLAASNAALNTLGGGGPTWTAQTNQVLLSATLLDSNSANGTPDLIGNASATISVPGIPALSGTSTALGFATQWNTTPGASWASSWNALTGGSTGSNFWLGAITNPIFNNLVNALDNNTANGTLASLFGTGTPTSITGVISVASLSAVSSVPLPGAIWFFGTGLISFIASRRKIATASLPA